MARIRYGLGIAALVGSVGSACFQLPGDAPVLRMRGRQVGRDSRDNFEDRATFADAAAQWRLMSADDRESWETWAGTRGRGTFGLVNRWSLGYQAFVEWFYEGGDWYFWDGVVGSENPDWPLWSAPESISRFVGTPYTLEISSAPTCVFVGEPDFAGTFEKYLIRVGVSDDGQRWKARRQMRLLDGVIEMSGWPYNLRWTWEDKCGPIRAGQAYVVEVRKRSTHQTSSSGVWVEGVVE